MPERAHLGLMSNIDSVTISWAIVRGIGSGLMHGICTLSIGLGASFVRKKKEAVA